MSVWSSCLPRSSAAGGTVNVGEAVKAAKLRYFLEAPRFDPYDEKTLMQWTLFGLPMVDVQTGISTGNSSGSLSVIEEIPARHKGLADETYGLVTVTRQLTGVGEPGKSAPPAYLSSLQLHFDFNAPGVYTKYDVTW